MFCRELLSLVGRIARLECAICDLDGSSWREAAEAMELDLRPVLKPVGLLLKSEEFCLTMEVAFALDYLAAELVEDFLILLTGPVKTSRWFSLTSHL